ncbi:MAG: hypothetical protein AAGA20_24205 [Planctomycetota bacterium]
MPHVTFIHGICNKPPANILLENWESELEAGGLNLPGQGVTTSMVYWADVMYRKPLEQGVDFESVESDLGTTQDDEDLAWLEGVPAEHRPAVDALRDRLRFDALSPEGDDYQALPPADEDGDVQFEAIPLPWFIKRRVMKLLLKDVYHYLFNVDYTPRSNETYRVRDHIRKLFVDQLAADSASNEGGRHVVVSHSMGTVISYDCLKNVDSCPGVDGYMTVGSPLGISEVHDNFDPKYAKRDAFPSAKLAGEWVNVYDRLDPVAFDARIANDYMRGGERVIVDQRVRNRGSWRHSSHKYFGQADLCGHLKRLLDL